MLLRNASTWAGRSWRARQIRCVSDLRPFAWGDNVILENTADRYAPPVLCTLQPGKKLENHKGVIKHEDIVGKRVRSSISAVQNTQKANRASQVYRMHEASLDEWVRLNERIVTPLYPSDASLIVNLLDLHPDPPQTATKLDPADTKLEILEAGTGHGSLTLHLSRAIHAANPPIPDLIELTADDIAPPEAERVDCSRIQANDPRLEEWRQQRRAVLHTIEVSSKHSKYARKTVSGFRNGMYARNVDFHIGDVSEWIQDAMHTRGSEPFLSHVILDLPSAEEHLGQVTDALRVNGNLIVFAPSITQIIECATIVKQQRFHLELQNVIELGVNGGSGGREWDVRFARARNPTPSIATPVTDDTAPTISDDPANSLESDSDAGSRKDTAVATSAGASLHLVCRPKVGERIVGGGFLGVWKKRRVDAEM